MLPDKLKAGDIPVLSMSERGWGVWPSTGSVVLDIPEVTNKYLAPTHYYPPGSA